MTEATTALWTWSVTAYAMPQVAELCLSLQDQDDQCVPLLLWAAWCAQPHHSQDAVDIARSWHEQAIAPLRVLRRRLKGPVSDMEPEARLAFREKVKVLELEGEKQLLSALETLVVNTDLRSDPLEALCAVARAWGTKIPRAKLSQLVEALSAGGFLRYDHQS